MTDIYIEIRNAIDSKQNRPRLHGNGFLQLDLPDNRRLHIWSDELPNAQKVDTTIHDHRFGFKSTILIGELVNTVYDFIPAANGEYRLYNPRVRRGEDTMLLPTEAVGNFRLNSATSYRPSQSYQMEYKDFHTSGYKGLSATLMEKMYVAPVAPRVACPLDMEPDNQFTRYDTDERELREIVERVLSIISKQKTS